jgi:hypothetical protein
MVAFVHRSTPPPVEIGAGSVDESRRRVEDAPELEVSERKVRRTLVAPGIRGIELLPRTPSGERDRSETKIRTTPRRLAAEGSRRPGGGACGIGGAGWIDRERHQYRSSGVPPDSGLVPGPDGSPTEGPLSLIPTRALRPSPGIHGRVRRGWSGPVVDLALVPCGQPGHSCGRDWDSLWTDLRKSPADEIGARLPLWRWGSGA